MSLQTPNPSSAVHAETTPSPLTMHPPSPPPSTSTSAPWAPARTASMIRKRSGFRLSKHEESKEPSTPKPKRNKLVRKRHSQPTFEMVSPSEARAVRAKQAAQLGFQLADLVAAIEENVSTESIGASKVEDKQAAVASREEMEIQLGQQETGTHNDSGIDDEELDMKDPKQKKRWSRAPLLPELDFASVNRNALLESTTHESPSNALDSIPELSRASYQTSTAPRTSKDPSKLTYRCNIHAQNSTSHLSVERACHEIVANAGGRILGSYSFPGGFMYWLPLDIPEPLATCELSGRGARIEVERWTEFAVPKFDGLKMHPPGERPGSERPMARSELVESPRAEEVSSNNMVQTWEDIVMAFWKSKESYGKSTRRGHDKDEELLKISKVATEKLDKCFSMSGGAGPGPASVESIRTVRQGGNGETQNNLMTPKSAQGNSEHRFAVVSDASDNDDESGAEEWESVRSEMDSQS